MMITRDAIDYVDSREAASILGISPNWLAILVRKNVLPKSINTAPSRGAPFRRFYPLAKILEARNLPAVTQGEKGGHMAANLPPVVREGLALWDRAPRSERAPSAFFGGYEGARHAPMRTDFDFGGYCMPVRGDRGWS